MDITPFNYLVDTASGQITAIVDWDSAKYLPIGHNLHFVEHLFGYMTTDGWEDHEDREALESFFYDRIRQGLLSPPRGSSARYTLRSYHLWRPP